MNYFLAIGLFSCVVSWCSATWLPRNQCPHDKINDDVSRCMDTHGFSFNAELNRFKTRETTAEDLKLFCDYSGNYGPTKECVYYVTKKCAPDTTSLTEFAQAMKDSMVYCIDSQVNFECMAEYYRNKSALQACVSSHWNVNDILQDGANGVMCYTRQLHIQCFTELLQECDSYTAMSVGPRFKDTSPTVCAFYSNFFTE